VRTIELGGNHGFVGRLRNHHSPRSAMSERSYGPESPADLGGGDDAALVPDRAVEERE
jgi:hypothetical protein